MDPQFSPQAIRFAAAPQAALKPAIAFGDEHAALSAQLAELPPESPAHAAQAQALICLESSLRSNWLTQQTALIEIAFVALIEAGEDPERWREAATESLRRELLQQLFGLRIRLQSEYLALLPPERGLAPLQRYVTAQLTKLDALRLNNASACEKSREAAQAAHSGLISTQVLPAELLALVRLDRLLDTAIRYQFAWEVALNAKGELAHHLTALQQIALTGLRPPRRPDTPLAAGISWDWHQGRLQNDLGVSLRCLRAGYGDWMKRGLKAIQQAVRNSFAIDSLQEALECFYAAHSVAREKPEALVALAWLLTLLNRPEQAVDCLELALRREALPEIKELFWLIQALDPDNQPSRVSRRKPRPAQASLNAKIPVTGS